MTSFGGENIIRPIYNVKNVTKYEGRSESTVVLCIRFQMKHKRNDIFQHKFLFYNGL